MRTHHLFGKILGLLALIAALAVLGVVVLTSGQCLENIFHKGHESRPIHAIQAIILSISIWAVLAAGQTALLLARARRRTASLIRSLSALATDPEPSLAATAAEVGLSGRLLVVPDERPLAITVGLVHPVVIVSTGLGRVLSLSAVKAVLAHEQAHLRRRDPLRVILARAVASAMGGLPGAEALAHGIHLEAELAADAHARRVAGDAALRQSLTALGEQWLRQDVVAAVGFTGWEADVLGHRLLQHLNEPARTRHLPAAVTAGRMILWLATMFALMFAVEASERWSTWCLM